MPRLAASGLAVLGLLLGSAGVEAQQDPPQQVDPAQQDPAQRDPAQRDPAQRDTAHQDPAQHDAAQEHPPQPGAGPEAARPAGNDVGPTALDEFIDDVESFTATFTQEVWSADEELIETSTGRLSLLRPDRFRISYDTPYESLIVTDGGTLWMYDVELEQVTRAPVEDGLSQAPAMLLSGDRSVSESFDVTQSYRLEGRDWVKLVPKQPGGDYSSVLLAFAEGLPERLEVVDGLNQITRIEFSDIEVNPDLDRALFEFEPPPGVDVIGGDG